MKHVAVKKTALQRCNSLKALSQWSSGSC